MVIYKELILRRVSLIIVLFLMGLNTSWAQRGIVDCSQEVKSDILNKGMNYSIFLPKSYNESNRSYPVLYLLHGRGGNHTSWVNSLEVNRITSKLIADGEIPEMIIIMPDGLLDTYYINNYDNSIRWEDFFYEEFIPNIENKYRILNKREKRAIAGISMGGYGALYHAINHRDMFKACYALGAHLFEIAPLKEGQERPEDSKVFQTKTFGPINEEGLPENYKKYSIQETIKAMETYKAPNLFTVKKGFEFELPAITIDCGDDDFLLNKNMNLINIMKEKKIPFEFRVRNGGHTWEYWRTGLEFALKSIGDSFRN